MKYFSVDRRALYRAGTTLHLQGLANPDHDIYTQHIAARFPAGLSPHGFLYYGTGHINYSQFSVSNNGGLLEMLLESVRQAFYPAKPSRYQSMFACGSVDECLHFRERHGRAEDRVFEVHPQAQPHRGDMGIYSISGTSANLDLRLHKYWRGETSEIPAHQPQWEFVVPLPAVIGSQVA